MGIKDLLRFLKPYVEPIHINKYAGKRVGIDAYSWLHKGAYSCSMELCLNVDGDKKLQYLKYCMHRINLLRHHQITPVVVFDGGNLPSKGRTEEDRHRKRKANLELAMEKLKDGNTGAAYELFQRAVSITPAMARQLIQILKSENIEFVVAPYEADAQLAYLSTLGEEKGGIAAVISEDSDLLAYGCPSVIFKMDRLGNGEEIVLDKVFDSVACKPSFRNFDRNLFIGMCVLAGCDFLPSISGIGMSKAYNLVSKYRNLDRVLSILKFEKKNQVPEDYVQSFKEAMAVFQHARIYDALSKSLKHIKPVPETILDSLNNELDFLGPDIPPSMATAIAEGKLDPCTMEAFSYFPSSESYMNLGSTFRTDQALRQETSTMSTQESCITVVSSHTTRGQRIKVRKQEPILEEHNYNRKLPSSEQWNRSAESLALEKLAKPFNSGTSEVMTLLADKNEYSVPNNNPFKKRKVDELVLNDQKENFLEQESLMTEVESVEILCATPESQQSVNSKPIKATERKWERGGEKTKKIHLISPDNKKYSILSFFPRV